MGMVKVDAYKCERCGHVWLPRDLPINWDGNLNTLDKAPPRVCPSCKSAYWNTPRKRDILQKESNLPPQGGQGS